MKKRILLISNLIIIFSLMAGFVGVVNRDTRMYQNLVEKHLENIVSLADINISKQIENSMTKPVMVSKTMANDEFLKMWLSKEKINRNNNTYIEQLYSYLKAYQLKYGYTTVFCVSEQTGNYYYQDGLSKTISKSDKHDIWYYNFTNSGNEYDLQIDTNQANKNTITIFVNFRIENDDGQLLGVIGVGLEVSDIENTICSYEKDYDLKVYIINTGGSKNSFSKDTDIFVSENELMKRTGIRQKFVNGISGEPKMQWFTSDGVRKCFITKYDDTLGWYLILEKDTNSISRSFQKGIQSNVIFMLISLTVCIVVTTVVFLNYNHRIIVIENTDELTGLPNRKLFSKQYSSIVRKHPEQKKTLFMFDVDNFKEINDTYGHIVGNATLTMVGEHLHQGVSQHGIVARWGGDEFIGVIEGTPNEAEVILKQFMERLSAEKGDSRYPVTISVGLVEINKKLSVEKMLEKVDKAVYLSKEEGRNRITVAI